MLTEERHNIILNEIDKKKVVYVSELVKLLASSESTIRRDLVTLHRAYKLKKVHGGATAFKKKINTQEEGVSIRKAINIEDKLKIAELAATQIHNGDFIYLDAGTTTELMINFLYDDLNVVFVTNGIEHARKLIKRGFKTHILAGKIKFTTEAIVGIDAVNSISKYNFTKGFFGANGVSKEKGFTTPDMSEAYIKEEAFKRCNKAYVLVDKLKFNEISSITFARVEQSILITTNLKDKEYRKLTQVMEV